MTKSSPSSASELDAGHTTNREAPFERGLVRTRSIANRGFLAVRDWATPEENPFLQRALRIENRKSKPLFSVAVVALLSLLACGALWYLWLHLNATIENPTPTWHWRSQVRLREAIVRTFGDNPINWFAMMCALVGALGVLWSSRARAAYLLRQELIKNSLVQLQQLPIAEERWLWMLAAHPAALGVLFWLTGLPMYALAVFTGQWRALDVLGLLILYLLLGHAPPLWMPGAWQQKNSKAVNKVTWQQWRALVKESRLHSDTGDIGSQLEAQRRLQRAFSGLSDEHSSSATASANSEDGDAEVSSDRQKKTGKTSAATITVGNTQRGGWNWFGSVIALNFVVQAASGMGVSSLRVLTDSWPREAAALWPAFVISWPILFAKLIFWPVAFFAFALPPALLIVPLWLGFSQQKFITLASQVSAAETFWNAPRLQRRALLNWLLCAGVLTFVFGYGWPLLIENGELARLLRGAPATANWAQAAGWTLAIFAATFIAGFQLEAPFKRAANGLLPLRDAWRESTLIVVRIVAFAVSAYFLFCWLGGYSGVPDIWQRRLPLTLATATAFFLADFGSAALGAILPPVMKRPWTLLRHAWFFGLAFLVVAYFAYAAVMQEVPFSFRQFPYVLLSPFVTLFALFRADISQPTPLIWYGLGVQAVAGILCALPAYRVIFHAPRNAVEDKNKVKGERENETDNAESTPRRGLREWKWLAPIFFIERVLLSPLPLLDKFVQAVGAWSDGVVAWGEKIDNPILTYELRRRVRRENWLWQWLGFFAGQTILFLTIAQPWRLLPRSVVDNPGYVPFTTRDFADWGLVVTVIVLSLMAIVAVLICLAIGRTFDSDRANGTLVFLFLTPQTNRSILLGKWLLGISYTLGVLSSGLVWLAIGGLVAAVPGRSPLIFALACCGLVAVLGLVYFASTVNLFFAVRAKKPTEGQGWALIVSAAMEIGLTILGAYVTAWIHNGRSVIPVEATVSVLLIASAVLHGLLGFAMWHLSHFMFARRRYGDIESSAKGAS